MFIKTGNFIRNVGDGETVFRDGRLIRIRVIGEGGMRRDLKVGAYKTEELAEAVLQDFWKYVKVGAHGYEFPED